MKVNIQQPTSLCVFALVAASNATINRTISKFLNGTATEDKIKEIQARARAIKILIRNDADSTARMIEMRPDGEEHYRDLWAECAQKLCDEVGLMIITAVHPDFSPREDDGWAGCAGVDLDDWVTPAPKQVTTPTPLEANAAPKETV